MAALLGAHIIKVKPPTSVISLPAAKKSYEGFDASTMAKRVAHVVQCCFGGRRLVVFSGGENVGTEGLLEVVRGLHDGGASGSIIGRNTFQRPKAEALSLLSQIIEIYRG
jgi:class I fructose-bisphosphate aldolase